MRRKDREVTDFHQINSSISFILCYNMFLEELALTKEERKMNELLKIPMLTMENTVHGKKDKYGDIVSVWKQYDGQVYGWVLLALVDTIEQMSKMIYEYYDELKVLFKKMLQEYYKDESLWDAKGGLAILKACRLDVISTERYAKDGLRMFQHDKDADQELGEAARLQWESIRQTWGLDDEF